MVKHIFKIIFNERKINIWILIELILVFCILWFCTDYITFLFQRNMEHTGFDTKHVYRINIREKEKEEQTEDNDNTAETETYNIWSIVDRIKQYPEIEHVSLSIASIPYSQSYSGGGVFIDTVDQNARAKFVTPEYFDVFKIKIEHGNAYNWDNIVGENIVVISADESNTFLKRPANKVEKFTMGRIGDTVDPDRTHKVVGVASRSKWSEYAEYEAIIYSPLKKDDKRLGTGELCVRVKPEADKDFAKRFTKAMQSQLALGHYYLSSVQSMTDIRDEYMKGWEYDSNLKSIYSITAFLIVNIFLGVVGTFWFRVQARRSEIGLRLALGSSRRNIRWLFPLETILLILIASIIAVAICINISLVDILKDMEIPTPNRGDTSAGPVQYIINYSITFFFLCIIAIAAVWYPAKRASDIQPAEALKDE